MEVKIILADAATVHPDGTFSLLRGGIQNTTVAEGQPLIFRGAMMLRIEATPMDIGQHEFAIKVINADGKDIAPNLSGGFEITQQGRVANLAVSFNFVFPAVGDYEFAVDIDGEPMGAWRHSVKTKSSG
jgi:hypothetical protein